MHYKTVHTINGNEDQNRAAFTIDFLDPPVVAVKEEYLVYDGVALISSVGGLLGICVGISFHGFSGVILRYLQVIFDWAKRQRSGDSKSTEHLFKKTNTIQEDSTEGKVQHAAEQQLTKIEREMIKLKTSLENIRCQMITDSKKN